MDRFVKVEDCDSLVKDTKSHAVISTDQSAYNMALQRKKSANKMRDLENTVDELKEMMKIIIQKLDK